MAKKAAPKKPAKKTEKKVVAKPAAPAAASVATAPKKIAATSKKSEKKVVVKAAPPAKAKAAATSSPYEEVWQTLTNKGNATNAKSMQSKLVELGLNQAQQLEHLDLQNMKDLSALLKPIPKRELASKVAVAAASALVAAATAATSEPSAKKVTPSKSPAKKGK